MEETAMSVSFCWAPRSTEKYFGSGMSRDRDALERTFGQCPWEFAPEHEMTLRAMHAATGTDKSLYLEIADAIEKHENIKVWPEY